MVHSNRVHYIKKLRQFKDLDLIKVVTGLRRAGKSTLLELFQQELISEGIHPKQIHAYNFELPENYLGATWDALYFQIKANLVPGQPNYIFLDEVQNISEFERLVDGLYATSGTDVYITGSNAFLLSSELATLLSGRYVEVSILPFSFLEYVQARGIDTSSTYINYEALFFDYTNETSLPKGVELRSKGFDSVVEYVQAIYTSVIEKDIRIRHRINDPRAFENIIRFLAANLGSPVSPLSISKALKNDGQGLHHATVERYLGYLTSSFVFYPVHRFDLKGRRQLATQEKYYIVDLGIRSILLGRDRTSDRGHALENTVYLELRRRGYLVWTGVYRTGEVDFVAKAPNGEIEYYQVAWQLSDDDVVQREFGGLEKIKDHYPKYVLTTDDFTQDRRGIMHRNVFKWLLG